jgi:DNA-binding NtrC family response regulator
MITNDVIQILLIEDEDYDVRRVRNTLAPFENQLIIKDVTSNGYDALKLLKAKKNNYDVVIMDFQIVGDLTGETLIRKIKEVDPSIQIIVITKMTVHVTDFNFANRLLEAGAMWYCTKYPGDIENYIYQPTDFILSIFNAYERRQIIKSQLRTQKKLNQNIDSILDEKPIIGKSETIRQLREQILQCAQSEATVLIRGQSGTGKELVAAHIHYNSSRKFEKFVAVNCGSLPAELIESELFGFEQGAFTGAKQEKPGLFEIANNGTLFLDEIGELPLGAQVKLLRALQEGEIDKIGRTDRVKVNVRIIAATNKNLEEEVRQKRFREDLYYRLNVITIQLLPLQHRSEDIVLLIEHFLQKFCHEMGRPVPEISSQAWDALTQYSWPGNVRELQNVVQRLLFINASPITATHVKSALGLGTQLSLPENAFPLPTEVVPLKEIEREFRKTYFQYVRKQTHSDADAAKLLGLAPPNFYRMCKELGIK